MMALVLVLLAGAPGGRPVVKGKPADAPVAEPTVVAPEPKKAPAAVVTPSPVPTPKASHAGKTECGVCHSTSAWTEVRFNHDRTGFPLTGLHTTVTCKACHVVDFERPLTRTCVGCHRDVHTGELGGRCENCHDTTTWRSRVDADAHRRSNFPLIGGHAALPCTECHFESSERRFTRSAVFCGTCHSAEYARTALTSIDHAANGFDNEKCLTCHNGFRFKPARYPNHDCFPLTGAHSLPCTSCHQSTNFTRRDPNKACSTGTVSCINCHEHDCSQPGNETDRLHKDKNVPGYGTQCTSTKCVACHGVRP